MYVAALLSQITRFVEMRAERLELESYVKPNTTIIGCQVNLVAASIYISLRVCEGPSWRQMASAERGPIRKFCFVVRVTFY